MDEINAIAARHGLPVIEDAAQSFGATYKGRRSCNLSTFGCTSFFPEQAAGLLRRRRRDLHDDDALAQACREIRVHGQSARYTHTRIGVGGRMDTLQCAVVLAKLERFDWELERRAEIGRAYLDQLTSCRVAAPVAVRPDRDSVWGQFTVLTNDRATLKTDLESAGIPTAIHYPIPLHRQPAYAAAYQTVSFLISERTAERVLSLPMSAYMDEGQVDRIVRTMNGI